MSKTSTFGESIAKAASKACTVEFGLIWAEMGADSAGYWECMANAAGRGGVLKVHEGSGWLVQTPGGALQSSRSWCTAPARH